LNRQAKKQEADFTKEGTIFKLVTMRILSELGFMGGMEFIG
jgi:hypothetical protein